MTLAEMKDQVVNCLFTELNWDDWDDWDDWVSNRLGLVLGMLGGMSKDELSESLGLREMHPVSHTSPPHNNPFHHLVTAPPPSFHRT